MSFCIAYALRIRPRGSVCIWAFYLIELQSEEGNRFVFVSLLYLRANTSRPTTHNIIFNELDYLLKMMLCVEGPTIYFYLSLLFFFTLFHFTATLCTYTFCKRPSCRDAAVRPRPRCFGEQTERHELIKVVDINK